jgi:hypothetical protein
MNNVPNVTYDVHCVRNIGWPTSREAYGHRASIVLREWESHLQGEGKQAGEMEGKAGWRDA